MFHSVCRTLSDTGCYLLPRLKPVQDIDMNYFDSSVENIIQVEPYLYLGMGQVSLYDEEGKIFFSRGVDLNDTIILVLQSNVVYFKTN